MDVNLHQKHENIKFADHTVIMFADIIESEHTMYEVFMYINANPGSTIKQITEHVILDRPLKKMTGDKFVFEKTHTNINRKAAEKSVDHLMSMSLCYEKLMKPYKFVNPTIRGNQVYQELQERLKINQ